MDFSFLKALTAAARGQVTGLKKQAKRLCDLSPELFGQPLSLTQCQEAVARSNGYRNWQEVTRLAQKIGADRSLPSWHLWSRNDLHERVLSALIKADVECGGSRPVILLGPLKDSTLVATCYWAELISLRKVPGLILIDTALPTFQDTPLWTAAHDLEITDIFGQFRVIDARQRNIPTVIDGPANEWLFAIAGFLTRDDQRVLDESGGRFLLERFMDIYQGRRYRSSDAKKIIISARTAAQAAWGLLNPSLSGVSNRLGDDEEISHIEHDLEKYIPRQNTGLLQRIHATLKEVENIIPSEGTYLTQESLHRPVVVLFDQGRPATVVIAGLIHALFYWHFVPERSIRPILYCSTEHPSEIPSLLSFGTQTVIATGCEDRNNAAWDDACMREGLFADVRNGSITVSGKRCQFVSNQGGDQLQ